MQPLRTSNESTCRPLPRYDVGLLLLMTCFLSIWAAAFGGDEPRTERPPFRLRDNDRIVMIGDTLIEREQKHGYIEAVLSSRDPKLRLTFRNVAWSGDSLEGLSRAYFDPPNVGTERQLEQVKQLNPDVLIVGYGMAESLSDLPIEQFAPRYEAMLQRIAGDADRIVLLSPNPHASLGEPWPDPAQHNRKLEAITSAIKKIADARQAYFVDLFHGLQPYYANSPRDCKQLAPNGIHLTGKGYLLVMLEIERQLGLAPWQSELAVSVTPVRRINRNVNVRAELVDDQKKTLAIRYTPTRLPHPVFRVVGVKPANLREFGLPSSSVPQAFSLRISGLAKGSYKLALDGVPVAVLTADQLAQGDPATNLEISTKLAGFEQEQLLREAIRRKDYLYFHRFRPQNITYLLGFRRHEQGQNASEIEQLESFIAQTTEQINDLRSPKPRLLTLEKATP